MSLFQCDKCGCAENTALTNSFWYSWRILKEDRPEIYASYREILGLKPGEEPGKYCSACTPVWFGPDRMYGRGRNPNPEPGAGLWHGRFPRTFLPKGQFETAPNGNLRKKGTGDEDYRKHALEREEGS